MDTYYSLGAGIALFAFVMQIVMLGLQLAAYRRHGHKSFLVLCLASMLGIVYCVLAGVPYLVPLDMSVLVKLTAASALIGGMSALMAILGTHMLFKSYRDLAESAVRKSQSGA